MVKFPQLFSGNWAFIKAFNGLVRRIQTTVEHMRITNTEGTALARGEVVALTAGQRQAIRAQADAVETAQWAAIVTEPIPSDETGISRLNGYGYVLFEDGLDPAPVSGDAVYLSSTQAGRATNALDFAAVEMFMGVVGDGTIYGDEGAAWVYLSHCCGPRPGQ